MMDGLRGKRVLITGAYQGIGHAVAKRFLQEGASVFMTDKAPASALQGAEQQLNAEFPGKIAAAHLDVADEQEIIAVVKGAAQAMGGIDVLVNNAGVNHQSPSHEFQAADFDRVLSINLRGAFLCSREVLKQFLAQGSGVIINNSSNHEIIPKPEFLAYAISKAGMGNLTRTLALEYADRGIRVNAVAPGATLTPLNASWAEDAVKRKKVEDHIPLGRAAGADEVAGAFAFLASADARYITGQTLFVDGGLTLFPDYRTNWAS
jgi:glucose 1-dehydrogenase